MDRNNTEYHQMSMPQQSNRTDRSHSPQMQGEYLRNPLKISAEKWDEVQEKITSLVRTNESLNGMVKKKKEELEKLQVEVQLRTEGESTWKKKFQQLEQEMRKLALIEKEVADYLPVMLNFEENAQMNQKAIENLNIAIRDKDQLILELQRNCQLAREQQKQDSQVQQQQWQYSQLESELSFYRQLSEQRQKQLEIIKEDKQNEKKDMLEIIMKKEEEIEKLTNGLKSVGDYEQKSKRMEEALENLRAREKHNFDCLLAVKDEEIVNLRQQLEIAKKKINGRDGQQNQVQTDKGQTELILQKQQEQIDLLEKKCSQYEEELHIQKEKSDKQMNQLEEQRQILADKVALLEAQVDIQKGKGQNEKQQQRQGFLSEDFSQQFQESKDYGDQRVNSDKILQQQQSTTLRNSIKQDYKTDQLLINQLQRSNDQLTQELCQYQAENNELISKIALLENKLEETVQEISIACSQKLETELLKVQLVSSEEKMILHNQIVLLQSQLELVQLENDAALRKKDNDFKSLAERSSMREEEVHLIEQRCHLEAMQFRESRDLQQSDELEKKDIKEMKKQIANLEDLLQAAKNEKVVYEEKILEFVSKVIELQKTLQQVQRERDQWQRSATLAETELELHRSQKRSSNLNIRKVDNCLSSSSGQSLSQIAADYKAEEKQQQSVRQSQFKNDLIINSTGSASSSISYADYGGDNKSNRSTQININSQQEHNDRNLEGSLRQDMIGSSKIEQYQMKQSEIRNSDRNIKLSQEQLSQRSYEQINNQNKLVTQNYTKGKQQQQQLSMQGYSGISSTQEKYLLQSLPSKLTSQSTQFYVKQDGV